MTGLQLAVLSLVRRKTATVVGILCVAVATFASGALISVVGTTARAFDEVDTDFDVIVGPKSSGLSVLLGGLGARNPSQDVLPYSLVRFVERKIEPRHIVPLHACSVFEGHPVFGTDGRFLNRPEGLVSPSVAEGRWFEATGEAILGSVAARETGLRIGDRFVVNGLIPSPSPEVSDWRKELEVVGILDNEGLPMDNAVLVGMETSQAYYNWELGLALAPPTKKDEAVTYFWISVHPEQTPLVKRWIHELSTAQMVDTKEEIAFLRSLSGGGKWTAWVLCSCILLLAVLGISVLVNARFESLKPELGLLRALGYSKLTVAGWILSEIAIIVLIAVALSILLEGIGIGWIDVPHLLSFTDTPTRWPSAWNLAVWFGVGLAALIVGIAPVVRLYCHNVQDSLQGF